MTLNLHKATMGLVATTLAVCATSAVVRGDDDGDHGGPATQYQTTNVVELGTGMPVGGAATLYRTHNRLWAHIATGGLDPYAAYTVWWVLWNRPHLCSAPCGEDDLAIPGNSVFYAAGFVTGVDGTVNVTAHLDAGLLPQGLDVLIPGGLRRGHGLRAEVHLVVRSHGPIIPGSVASQIGTFLGGCDVNLCVDQQAAVFAPIY